MSRVLMNVYVNFGQKINLHGYEYSNNIFSTILIPCLHNTFSAASFSIGKTKVIFLQGMCRVN